MTVTEARRVKAKYVRRSVCECGFPALHDSVPLGKIYTVYPDTVRNGGILCGGCGARTDLQLIDADDVGGRIGTLPLGIFEFDEGLA